MVKFEVKAVALLLLLSNFGADADDQAKASQVRGGTVDGKRALFQDDEKFWTRFVQEVSSSSLTMPPTPEPTPEPTPQPTPGPTPDPTPAPSSVASSRRLVSSGCMASPAHCWICAKNGSPETATRVAVLSVSSPTRGPWISIGATAGEKPIARVAAAQIQRLPISKSR